MTKRRFKVIEGGEGEDDMCNIPSHRRMTMEERQRRKELLEERLTTQGVQVYNEETILRWQEHEYENNMPASIRLVRYVKEETGAIIDRVSKYFRKIRD